MSKVDLLILGAGWTSTFLIPLLKEQSITYAATTTTGREGTYKFVFDIGDKPEQYAALPEARTILITFPLKGKNQSSHLHSSYLQTHDSSNGPYHFIQLGSTGIFSVPDQDLWVTRHSKYDQSDARAIAEDELLQLGGCVLDLSGLWGGERQPKKWVNRVAPTKEQLKKQKSLHMIHGEDVARAIIAVHGTFSSAKAQRFMLTSLMVYDWWVLILGFGDDPAGQDRPTDQAKWVWQLMQEGDIRALPRSAEQLGRCYDSREFWTTFNLMPLRSKI